MLLADKVGLCRNPEAAPKNIRGVGRWGGRVSCLREGKTRQDQQEEEYESQRLLWFDTACSAVNGFSGAGAFIHQTFTLDA